MSDDVKLVLEGTVDEALIKKTGSFAGKGAVTIEIPDVNKSTFSFDYKDKDHVKLQIKSQGEIKVSSEANVKPKGEVDYNFLKNSLNCDLGMEIVFSKKFSMDFNQSFGDSGTASSAKFTIKI